MSFQRTCPLCESRWPTTTDFCPKDGTRLGVATLDRYELVASVAQSGLSEVYQALHVHTGRRVAIKLLHASALGDDDMVQRLRREGRATSAIGHPNIIDVTDFGTTDRGEVYMVMEWIHGSTIRTILDSGPVPAMLALDIACQVAQGLEAAHDIGVVHRDIKPENIMVCSGPNQSLRVKILDFGIAKLMGPGQDKLTITGAIIGTPAYISPEQARGEPIDPRADIYSVGCLLFDLFCGSPLFSANTPMELVLQHAGQAPDRPSLRAPDRGISAELDSIILRCLEKDRDLRYAHMTDLKRALLSLQQKDLPRTAEAELEAARTMMFRGRGSAPPPPAMVTPAPPPSMQDLFVAKEQHSNRKMAWILFGLISVVAATTLVLLLKGEGKQSLAESAKPPSLASQSASSAAKVLAPGTTKTPSTPAEAQAKEPEAKSPEAGEPEAKSPEAGEPEAKSPAQPAALPIPIWQHERSHSKFRIKLQAGPRPLMPREPIELEFQLSELRDHISWAVTEGHLRADIKFVHFVKHETLGSLTGSVDDSGAFKVIFSVPQTGKYHLEIRFTNGKRVVGRTQMDICVGIDPDAPDVASLCPDLNQFTGRHGAAR